LLEYFKSPGAGYPFNAPDSGSDARFLNDLEQADIAGGAGMGAAAQLHAEIAYPHHSHAVAVFFAEQGGGSRRNGRLGCHLLDGDLHVFPDAAIHFPFHPGEFIGAEGREVNEVEP
jgi:hypothetical protein